MKKAILFIVVISLTISCKDAKPTITDFQWLEGKWVGPAEDMDFFEEWKPLNGNVLNGIGGGTSGTDTVFSEKIKIEQRGEDIFYTATVEGNNGSVDFKFTGYKKDSIVFENPAHDFPQRVIYYRQSDNKYYACVDGKNDGEYSRIEFSLQKAK